MFVFKQKSNFSEEIKSRVNLTWSKTDNER